MIIKHELGLLDTHTGLVWFNQEPNKYSYNEAMEKFNTPVKRLPTKEEFQNIKPYFGELKFIDDSYWSSSLSLVGNSSAWYFDGYLGYYSYINRSHKYIVRCVASLKDLHNHNFGCKLESIIND